MRHRLLLVLVLSALLAGCAEDAPAPAPQASTAPASPAPAATQQAPPSAAASTAPAVALTAVSRPDPDTAAQEAGLDSAGSVLALSWHDRAGHNTVVLRELQPDPEGDKELLADHVAVSDTGTRTVLREVRDAERDCDGDLTAEFVEEALEVRDDDRDGYGEVLFAYRLACRTDPGQSDLKLLLLEHGDKHILRGLSTNTVETTVSEPTPEPAPDAWPAGSYEAASAAFDRVQEEF